VLKRDLNLKLPKLGKELPFIAKQLYSSQLVLVIPSTAEGFPTAGKQNEKEAHEQKNYTELRRQNKKGCMAWWETKADSLQQES
jgi:hypothetical protein